MQHPMFDPEPPASSGMDETDAFFLSIEKAMQQKGRGGPPIEDLKNARAEELTRELLARNEKLTLEAKQQWYKKLLQDPVLADLTPNSTLEDVESLIAQELGTSFLVNLVKMDEERIALHLFPNITVRELKLRIQHVISAKVEKPELMGIRKVSWPHVWDNYCLMFEGQRLLDPNARLRDLGVFSGAEIYFARYIAKKVLKDMRPRREKRPRRYDGAPPTPSGGPGPGGYQH